MPAMLAEFIKEHGIDLKAIERMRKRVMVVGRFNNKPFDDKKTPDLYLFTNRQDVAGTRYAENFELLRSLDYTSFVDALKPRIAEREDPVETFKQANGVPLVMDVVKLDASNTDANSYVINALNYFFLRAVSTTEHDQFKKDSPSLPNLLDKQAGQTIYTQFRANLSTFCEFQPRSVELIDAIAKLFVECTGGNAIPLGYSYGEKLPVHFAEKFIDYLYDEDGSGEFKLDGIDFSVGCWHGLVTNERSRTAFRDIVTAFKNAILDYPPMFTGTRYTNGNLSSLSRNAVSGELSQEFRKSKDAFSMLRQIMRSKVLLSMILEWVLNEMKELPDVRNLQEGKQKNMAIEKAIMEDWEDNGLAKPIKRPAPEERSSFTKAMGTSFESLIEALLSEDESKMDDLTDELKALAEQIKEDPQKMEALQKCYKFCGQREVARV